MIKKSLSCILAGLFLGLLLICSTIVCSSVRDAAASASSVPTFMASSRQLVVVRTADWDAFEGTLQRYERTSEAANWKTVGAVIPAVVGRNGLAWGVGLSDDGGDKNAPVKLEGDGKGPAGAFSVGPAFGFEPPSSVPWIRFPYFQSDKTYKCVDDIGSRHYNRLVFEGQTEKDWKSSEDMLRNDDLYRLGLVIQHNWGTKTESGRGSCIFLHIWLTADKGTAGCTAITAADMVQLLGWLDPRMNPVLVQLPESEYARFRDIWQLP
jgi:L,D-peptidoglycan transpeptidase YkuD (ErfK/YbiS/YcfS/YnhG family)